MRAVEEATSNEPLTKSYNYGLICSAEIENKKAEELITPVTVEKLQTMPK